MAAAFNGWTAAKQKVSFSLILLLLTRSDTPVLCSGQGSHLLLLVEYIISVSPSTAVSVQLEFLEQWASCMTDGLPSASDSHFHA